MACSRAKFTFTSFTLVLPERNGLSQKQLMKQANASYVTVFS
jgi:hypothetical protein